MSEKISCVFCAAYADCESLQSCLAMVMDNKILEGQGRGSIKNLPRSFYTFYKPVPNSDMTVLLELFFTYSELSNEEFWVFVSCVAFEKIEENRRLRSRVRLFMSGSVGNQVRVFTCSIRN